MPCRRRARQHGLRHTFEENRLAFDFSVGTMLVPCAARNRGNAGSCAALPLHNIESQQTVLGMRTKDTALLAIALVLLGCGGGSGSGDSSSGGPPAPAPTLSVVPAPPVTNADFPLQISAPNRYLQTAAGQPHFLQGDSAWSLIAQL